LVYAYASLQHLVVTDIYFIVILRSDIGDFNLIYPRIKTYLMAFVFIKNASLVGGR